MPGLQFHPLKWLIIVAALGLISIMPALAQNTANRPGCPVGGHAIIACPVTTDDVIRQAVITRLMGPVITSNSIVSVEVRNGIVTLSGIVSTPAQRDMAPILVSTLNGVVRVNNLLGVTAGNQRDLAIIAEVRKAFNRQPFDTRRIIVESKDGVVQLSGAVETDYDADMAELVAQGVMGVATVYNNLTVLSVGGTF